jgi:hypothetical protein
METMIRRPELALRGYELVARKLKDTGILDENESFFRNSILALASKALSEEAIEEDPKSALLSALSIKGNTLLDRGREVPKASAWVNETGESEIRELTLNFIYGDEPLVNRATRFLDATSKREISPKKVAHINETVSSFLLGMARPDKYAFLKPTYSLQPAYRLLVSSSGAHIVPNGPDRIEIGTQLYKDLQELWSTKSDFKGDLFDVHTILFCLGPHGYYDKGVSWARAMSFKNIAEFVRLWTDDLWKWHKPLENAASLVQPLLRREGENNTSVTASLDNVALGIEKDEHNLADIVLQSSKVLPGLQVTIPPKPNTSALFRIKRWKVADWQIGEKRGHSRDEAEAIVRAEITPLLEELLAIATSLVKETEPPSDSRLLEFDYEQAIGKLLLLFSAALDVDWAYSNLAILADDWAVYYMGSLLDVTDTWDTNELAEYTRCQRAIANAWQEAVGVDTVPLAALSNWFLNHPIGKMIHKSLEVEVGYDEDVEEDEDEIGDTVGVTDARTIGKGKLSRIRDRDDDTSWVRLLDMLDDPTLRTVTQLLSGNKNVVLHGPPGTGKTYHSVELAKVWRAWQKDKREESEDQGDDEASGVAPTVEQVTFHPSYGYEEFVEGFRPHPSAPGEFTLLPGVLSNLARRAMVHPYASYLLLIDEINRGDVARIFGELITLLEADKRSEEHARRRMYSQQALYLPPNVYVLGTMNTADKSISLIDVALRRRFVFHHLAPSAKLLNTNPDCLRVVDDIDLSRLLVNLNKRLLKIGIYGERHIGHSYLMVSSDLESPEEELVNRFHYAIVPLVEEYCFSDRTQMQQVLGEDMITEHGTLVDDGKDTTTLLDAIRKIARGEP